MGDKATLRMARQELEDLYLGVPDDSVDLTFKDLAVLPPSSTSSSSLPVATTSSSNMPPPLPPPPHAAVVGDDDDDVDAVGGERKRNNNNKMAELSRSSTNIFTYRPLEDREEDVDDATLAGTGGGGVLLLQLPSPPLPPPPRLRHHHGPAASDVRAGAVAAEDRVSRSRAGRCNNNRNGRSEVHQNNHGNNYISSRQRPGIPHSNICALCNKYVYLVRHRCLVCGRLYCRRCVGAGMGDMTEGRKCIDCLGRRYSHRYIHRAGDTAAGCCLCFWRYYPSAKAVTAQELVWAEKGPAPRRRPPRHHPVAGSSSIVSTSTIASASMSMTINSDISMASVKRNGGAAVAGSSIGGMPASASSSFVASHVPNPHALPL